MAYNYNKYNSSEETQVGYNLLAQRTMQLSNLSLRANDSFLKGRIDDYFFTLISLRQKLTPDLNKKETKFLNLMEKKIQSLKTLMEFQKKAEEKDKPGFNIMFGFKKYKNIRQEINYMSAYVEKIKKFDQALLIIMKRKGFFPGKADHSLVS